MGQNSLLRRALAVLLAVVCLVHAIPSPALATPLDDPDPSEVSARGDGEPGDDHIHTDADPTADNGDDTAPPDDGDDNEPDDDTDNNEPDDQDETDTDPSGEEEEDGEEEEKDPVPTLFDYNKKALRALLEELAAELELDADHLVSWLFEDERFTEDARERIWDALTDNRELAAAFFAATQELYEELGIHTNKTRNPDREIASADGLDDILAVAEGLRHKLDGSEIAFMAAMADAMPIDSVITPIDDDPNLIDLTRTALRRPHPNGGTNSSSGDDEVLFRHYDLELGFTAGSGISGGAADIVLLIDNSLSTQYALPAMRTAAESLVSRPEVYEGGSRVAVVTFSDEGNLIWELDDAADPDDPDGGPNPDLIAAIRAIEPQGQSNLQAGLIEARRALGLRDDDEAEEGGVVVLFTDGMANSRVSDIWRLTPFSDRELWRYEIELNWDGEAVARAKRWSWRTTNTPYSRGTIWIDGEIKTGGIDYNGGEDFSKSVARLEAQHLVSQGVDLYAVNYGTRLSSDPAYMDSLTLRLEEDVDFLADVEEPPYDDAPARTARPFTGSRVYDPGEAGFVDELLADILVDGDSALPVFTLDETLAEDFEYDAAHGWTLTTPDGQEHTAPAGWTLDASADGGELAWTTPAGLESGTYTIRYGVRVRDDADEPLRHLPDGGPEIAPSESASISYETTSYDYADLAVEVPPLLGITATGPEVVFAGETVRLEGEIFRGNGDYTYAWYDPEESDPVESGPVPLDDIDPAAGTGLAIPVPALDAAAGTGTLVRLLEVTDTRAWEAGYSGGRLRERVEVAVVSGRLTVRILGEDGANYTGRFEATIAYTGEDGAGERYHLMGPGTAVYTPATGLRQGDYEVSLHVPYGYRAAQGPQTATITPQQDAQGNWIDCERSVSIQIERTWAGYFFSWADRLEAVGGMAGLLEGGGDAA